MIGFLAKRLAIMVLTMICLSMVVFFLVNLDPNLRKLSISQTNMRASDTQIESWLETNGYRQPFFERYGAWLGVLPKQPNTDPATGDPVSRFRFCDEPDMAVYAGVLQGNFGCSTKFKTTVGERLFPALRATGILMFWVMLVMVPSAWMIRKFSILPFTTP